MNRIINTAMLVLCTLTLSGCWTPGPDPAYPVSEPNTNTSATESEDGTPAHMRDGAATVEIAGKTYPLPLLHMTETYQLPYGESGAVSRTYLNQDPEMEFDPIPVNSDRYRRQRENFVEAQEPTYPITCIFYTTDYTKCTNEAGTVLEETFVVDVVTLVRNDLVISNEGYRCNLVCVDRTGKVRGRVSDEMLKWRSKHCLNPKAGVYYCKWADEKLRLG